MEGGRDSEDVLAEAQGFDTARDALEMAMGVEAQALDLYMRYAALAAGEDTRAVLRDLAREESGHLKALGAMMDRLGGKGAEEEKS